METKTTERGFDVIEFQDRNDVECSLQKSSLATEDCIWIGVNDANPRIMASDVIKLGEFNRKNVFEYRQTGWVKYHVPDSVLMSTRMHLTREQVKALLPILEKFVETGELS